MFWALRTDAPTNALQFISTSLTAYLGTNGFEPDSNNDICSAFPGRIMDNMGHPANIKRSFYIGFDKLIEGLIYVKGEHDAPPPYCFTGIACAAMAVFTGEHVGIHALPGDQSPQNFGVTLISMYPDPSLYPNTFLDNTNTFYSPY